MKFRKAHWMIRGRRPQDPKLAETLSSAQLCPWPLWPLPGELSYAHP